MKQKTSKKHGLQASNGWYEETYWPANWPECLSGRGPSGPHGLHGAAARAGHGPTMEQWGVGVSHKYWVACDVQPRFVPSICTEMWGIWFAHTSRNANNSDHFFEVSVRFVDPWPNAKDTSCSLFILSWILQVFILLWNVAYFPRCWDPQQTAWIAQMYCNA